MGVRWQEADKAFVIFWYADGELKEKQFYVKKHPDGLNFFTAKAMAEEYSIIVQRSGQADTDKFVDMTLLGEPENVDRLEVFHASSLIALTANLRKGSEWKLVDLDDVTGAPLPDNSPVLIKVPLLNPTFPDYKRVPKEEEALKGVLEQESTAMQRFWRRYHLSKEMTDHVHGGLYEEYEARAFPRMPHRITVQRAPDGRSILPDCLILSYGQELNALRRGIGWLAQARNPNMRVDTQSQATKKVKATSLGWYTITLLTRAAGAVLRHGFHHCALDAGSKMRLLDLGNVETHEELKKRTLSLEEGSLALTDLHGWFHEEDDTAFASHSALPCHRKAPDEQALRYVDDALEVQRLIGCMASYGFTMSVPVEYWDPYKQKTRVKERQVSKLICPERPRDATALEGSIQINLDLAKTCLYDHHLTDESYEDVEQIIERYVYQHRAHPKEAHCDRSSSAAFISKMLFIAERH
ncbi:unnamed protein product [Vitrella brassicaformis CCMP3155]|uniref:Uncharacterized protein n=2 Tax=Vitrella brassicaformis TaxID=1169539 RepID=A0A0G4FRS0_VITBC|nr:unnamed protein product [Vitrella brassicaformis CCMP3155]|eukprot:CEM17348.1 unnamed protein product [Vitrella brassicaformis CCMP3155]